MDDTSYDHLIERLAANDGPDATTTEILLAAAEGEDALDEHLDTGEPVDRRPATSAPEVEQSPTVYLESIAVEGLRGIGPRAQLPLEPQPGLTLVVGRNGSGKSSFAEGLELLLTNRNERWEDKTKVWREGWHNLHVDGQARVSAHFHLDGNAESLEVRRTWPSGAKLTDSTIDVSEGDWASLGWDVPLQRFRPILSYNELGAMFSSRAKDLYEALAAILGLEPFEALSATVRSVRLARERPGKDEKVEREALQARLADSDDERAAAISALLGAAAPDLDAVGALLLGDDTDDVDVERLQALAALPLPDSEAITSAFAARIATTVAAEELARTDAQRIDRIAKLLEHALALHGAHGDAPCPVCGEGRLDSGWSLRAQAEVQELQKQASDLRAAREGQQQADRRVAALFSEAVRPHAKPELWEARLAGASQAEALRVAAASVRDDARAELDRRNAAWRPLEQAIDAWLTLAERARADAIHVKTLKAAEAWMKDLLILLRRERLAPIVEAAQANWEELRHESNVQLGDVELKTVGNNRSAVFDVTVDGEPTSAYGVMSQGELSALAISVFLPRASLPQSPFRFLVIDDPVQSMDPAKVDGLARVLAAAAGDRQVIVFTHDERLPQAVHHLGISARVIRVQRRAKSKVEIVAGAPPSDRYIGDAMALAKSEDVAVEIRRRTVPVHCRSAIEAACETRIRRRMLTAGETRDAIEAHLAGLTSTRTWLCSAMELSTAQGHELAAKVKRIGGEGAWSVVMLATKGAHADQQIDPLEQACSTRELVKALEAA